MTFTAKQFADSIDGCERGSELTGHGQDAASASGLLVVYGYSDDVVVLGGAFTDHIDAYDGTEFKVNKNGVVPVWGGSDTKEIDEAREFFEQEDLPSFEIVAGWDTHSGYSWYMQVGSSISHASFDVLEDGEKFCRGLVIDLNSLNPPVTGPSTE